MKKIICLVLALAMFVSTSMALTPDEAARDLGKYGIMGGFPDGTLRLEQNVTRAQMTKMLVCAMKDRFIPGVHGQFADVPNSHWAKDYINFACMDGIVGGVGNGLFKPDDNVTCDQVLKMVVCMLKLDQYEKYKDGYEKRITFPDTYYTIANRYELIKGLDYAPGKPATRGFVAVVLSRALDIDAAEMNGIKDGKPVWEISNGKTLRTQLEK